MIGRLENNILQASWIAENGVEDVEENNIATGAAHAPC
jgi:hypothetical protein